MRAIALAVFTLLACAEKHGAPPCEAVGTTFVLRAKADLDTSTADADTRRLVLDQLPAMRDSLVHACKESKWEPVARDCMTKAESAVAFASCENMLTPAQRDALERGDSDER